MRGMVLETGVGRAAARDPRRPRSSGCSTTPCDFWKSWLAQSTYTGRWRETLNRSAITLKLMTYAPSGGLVAAPTAGLPEQVGGERNWDYRYTWVRDASFSVYALLGLGFTEEAARVRRVAARPRRASRPAATAGPLNIMYRVDGSRDLDEEVLEHWEGYRGSSPVRIGNGAADQLQLDIYGEAIDSIYFADQRGLQCRPPGLAGDLRHRSTGSCDNWDQPEEGIWETRGGRQDFTYGRLMSWVALDRGIRLATEHGRPAPVDRWRAERDAIYDQIMEQGWSPKRQAFVQHYDDRRPGLLAAADVDGRVRLARPTRCGPPPSTAMDDELVTDSLVYRYDPSASPDGLRGSEGTFSLCTFAYVDALARAGPARRGPAHLREDAHLRQPPRACTPRRSR